MEIGRLEFRKMTEFIELTTIEVYGRPSEKALKLLREKAEMLGRSRVMVPIYRAEDAAIPALAPLPRHFTRHS